MFLTKYFCFANFRFKQQANALIGIMVPNFEMIDILVCVGSMALQNDQIVPDAVYNNVLNYLTGRPQRSGAKDIDAFYFHQKDLSYQAEDKKIKESVRMFLD